MYVDSVPAVASSAATSAPIPFSRDTGGQASGATSLLVAGLLLAAAFAVLWALKRRGWQGLASHIGMPATPSGVVVIQRLRLSASSAAYVLRDGEARLLVVESRAGVQVTHLSQEVGSGEVRGEGA